MCIRDRYRDGYVHHDHYERGNPTVELEHGLLPTLGKTRKTGTKIRFLPDPEIFEKTRFKAEEVKSRMHETAYLNPNLTIIFEDRRGSEVEHIEYHEPDGLVGFVKDLDVYKRQVLKITAIVAATLFLTVYGVGCWYFYTHYFYGTKIDGVIYGLSLIHI